MPGLWINVKSKCDRKSDHQAYRFDRAWDVEKYNRFLWSDHISKGQRAPSKYTHQ